MNVEEAAGAGHERLRAVPQPTRREKFLAEMQTVVPWKELCALIEPYYPKATSAGGRPRAWSGCRASIVCSCGSTCRIRRWRRRWVEDSIGVIKQVFGFQKVRYRGLAKNGNRVFVTAALANIFLIRYSVLGAVRPQ